MKLNYLNLHLNNVLLGFILGVLLLWWKFSIPSENVGVSNNFNPVDSGWTVGIYGGDYIDLGGCPLIDYALPSTPKVM